MDDPEHAEHAEHAREHAYAELCRRMAGLRDQDPNKLRFYWGSLFVHVLCDLGGLSWDDVEPLWHRWRGTAQELRTSPSGDRRRARHGRSRHRRGRRRRVRLEEPFPLPEPAGSHARKPRRDADSRGGASRVGQLPSAGQFVHPVQDSAVPRAWVRHGTATPGRE